MQCESYMKAQWKKLALEANKTKQKKKIISNGKELSVETMLALNSNWEKKGLEWAKYPWDENVKKNEESKRYHAIPKQRRKTKYTKSERENVENGKYTRQTLTSRTPAKLSLYAWVFPSATYGFVLHIHLILLMSASSADLFSQCERTRSGNDLEKKQPTENIEQIFVALKKLVHKIHCKWREKLIWMWRWDLKQSVS